LIYLQKGEKTNDHICELSAAADMFVFQKTTALCYVDTEQILDGALLFLGTKSKQSFFSPIIRFSNITHSLFCDDGGGD